MRVWTILTVSAFAAQAQYVAAADDAIALKASSPWNLSYDEQGCALARKFGDGDRAVISRFSKYEPSTSMEIVLLGKILEPEGYSFEAAFMPGDEPYKHENAMYGKGDAGTSWQFTTGLIPHEEFDELIETKPVDRHLMARREEERAAQVTQLTITKGIGEPVTLELGDMAKPMAAMDTCIDDLIASWGFDPQVQRNLSQPPEPINRPDRWIRPIDYPRNAMRNGISGQVRFRLNISADGDVTDCTIQSAMSDFSFQETTCRLVTERAKFTPGLDQTGQPVASFWASTVAFVAAR
ncbi:energy transducer TonB [Pelagerythrobacter sp.]|uniref:energy transducer TonB n=1 Tax=Pelagerythrobacter sp. TaxID=2800702 RepID=UPI0035B0B44D